MVGDGSGPEAVGAQAHGEGQPGDVSHHVLGAHQGVALDDPHPQAGADGRHDPVVAGGPSVAPGITGAQQVGRPRRCGPVRGHALLDQAPGRRGAGGRQHHAGPHPQLIPGAAHVTAGEQGAQGGGAATAGAEARIEAQAEGAGDRLAADPVRGRPGQRIDLDMGRGLPVDAGLDAAEQPRAERGLPGREAHPDHLVRGDQPGRLVLPPDGLAEGIGGVDDDRQVPVVEGTAGGRPGAEGAFPAPGAATGRQGQGQQQRHPHGQAATPRTWRRRGHGGSGEAGGWAGSGGCAAGSVLGRRGEGSG